MIGACHALVKRLQHEAFGLVAHLPGSNIQVPISDPPADLDIAPSLADDGLLAGKSDEVLRALRHLKLIMARFGLKFSTLQVVPAAGRNAQVDHAPFVAEGCTIQEDGNCEVLKSPIGDEKHCKQFCKKQAAKHSAS